MATVKFLIKGNNNPSTIFVRFKHGRKYDFTKSTSLIVDPSYWSDKGKVKQISAFNDKLNLQNQLNNLNTHLLNTFNDVYSTGGIINSDWLNKTIKTFFNQDSKTDLNYFLDYAKYFKENLKTKVLSNGSTGVKENTYNRYQTIINKFAQFEKHKGKRYTFDIIDLKFYKDFKNYLVNTDKLNLNTVGRYINYVKTICIDAKKYGIKISVDVEKNEFRPTKESVDFITLSETEIKQIYKYDFSKTPYLQNARDWLIIGVWTGARVSDLLKFTASNIHNNFIEYAAQKTEQKILLPLHPQVIQILEKNNGQFPHKIASQNFNVYIKTVCEKVGLNETVKGAKSKKLKKGVWRKVKGEHPKHNLVTSHICRRSFATNHYGKLPTPVIMAITGHKTEKMFLSYIGETSTDNAKQLQNFWNDQEQKKQQKPKLEIVKTEIA